MTEEAPNYAYLSGFLDPVLLVDGNRQLVYLNSAASKVIDANTIGRDLAISFRHPSALEVVDEVLKDKLERIIEITIAAPVSQTFQLQANSVELAGGLGQGAMIVLRDVTSLKTADQMRQDFVANVSHELRSPISSLVGMIETLQSSAKDDPSSREKFLQIMGDEAARMARLIDDLLSLSRVEVSEHVPPITSVSIGSILETTIELLQGRASKKNIALELTLPDTLPEIPGDPDELTEVFQNLIDNAIKYGNSKSEINIVIEKIARIPDLNHPGVSISIINQGERIAPEHIPRLTERFYRVDKGRSRTTGGTGLGLAIVKHIVNRHRGKLVIESLQEKTAKFTVFLPHINQ